MGASRRDLVGGHRIGECPDWEYREWAVDLELG
jgi:hypothetical protein